MKTLGGQFWLLLMIWPDAKQNKIWRGVATFKPRSHINSYQHWNHQSDQIIMEIQQLAVSEYDTHFFLFFFLKFFVLFEKCLLWIHLSPYGCCVHLFICLFSQSPVNLTFLLIPFCRNWWPQTMPLYRASFGLSESRETSRLRAVFRISCHLSLYSILTRTRMLYWKTTTEWLCSPVRADKHSLKWKSFWSWCCIITDISLLVLVHLFVNMADKMHLSQRVLLFSFLTSWCPGWHFIRCWFITDRRLHYDCHTPCIIFIIFSKIFCYLLSGKICIWFQVYDFSHTWMWVKGGITLYMFILSLPQPMDWKQLPSVINL